MTSPNPPSVEAIEELLPDEAALLSMTQSLEAFIDAHPEDWTETRAGAAWLEILEALETLGEVSTDIHLAFGALDPES